MMDSTTKCDNDGLTASQSATWLPFLRDTLPDSAALSGLLEHLGQRLRAVAGAAWFVETTFEGQSALRRAAFWGAHPAFSGYADPQADDMQRAAAESVRGGIPLLLMPGLHAPERGLFNRSAEPIVALPLFCRGAAIGVFQWWASPEIDRSELARLVEQIQSETAQLGLTWKKREARVGTLRTLAQSHMLQLALDVVGSRNASEIAQKIAVHATAVLGGERATVITRTRGRWRVLAVSGVDRIDPRGSHARAAIALASAIENQPAAGTNGLRFAPNSLLGAASFVESPAGLAAHATLEWSMEAQQKPWGVIWLEGASAEVFEYLEKAEKAGDEKALAPSQVLRRMAASALSSALAREQGFLGRLVSRMLPVASFEKQKASVRWSWRLGPVLLLLAAGFWPLPVKLEADCIVKPAVRGFVAAEVAGRVDEILVREGDKVQAGEIIARLDDSRLETELQTAEQLRLRYEGEAERYRGKGDEAMARVSSAQARAAEAECKRLKSAIDLCVLKTPVAGVVVTRDLHLLSGIYLEAGQNFAEVTGTTAWNLRLELREEDLELLSHDLAKGNHPEVRYILHTLSSEILTTFLGDGQDIGPMVVHTSGNGTVPVLVGPLKLPVNSAFHLRSGLSGKAVVVLPSRPAFQVLTRDFCAWLRMRWWL